MDLVVIIATGVLSYAAGFSSGWYRASILHLKRMLSFAKLLTEGVEIDEAYKVAIYDKEVLLTVASYKESLR